MILNYPQKSNGMFILKRTDIDEIADLFMNEKLNPLRKMIVPIDINYIAEEICFLTVEPRTITKSGLIMALISFGDVVLPLYDVGNRRNDVSISEGTILIEKHLTEKEHLKRYRFTLAHEVSHWLLHRSYHSPTNQQYQLRKNTKPYFACKSQDIERKKRNFRTDNDWEEWQADSLAASLLMPREIFNNVLTEVLRKNGLTADLLYKRVSRKNELIVKKDLSKTFQVSQKAVEIRLKDLGFIEENSLLPAGIDVFC